ncbi:ribosomal protein S8A, partial [Coemansia sp. S2]
AEKPRSKRALAKCLARKSTVESAVDDQFVSGRLYAIVTSRPGQSGRCDGYILEGKELDFYLRKIRSKK